MSDSENNGTDGTDGAVEASAVEYVVVFAHDHTVKDLGIFSDGGMVECDIPEGKIARALRDGFAAYVKSLRSERVVIDAGVTLAKRIKDLERTEASLRKIAPEAADAILLSLIELRSAHDAISRSADDSAEDGVQTVADDSSDGETLPSDSVEENGHSVDPVEDDDEA